MGCLSFLETKLGGFKAKKIVKAYIVFGFAIACQKIHASTYCSADYNLSVTETIVKEEPRGGTYYEERCRERGGQGDHRDGYYICFRRIKEIRSVSSSGSYESDARADAEKQCRSYARGNSNYDFIQYSGMSNWNCEDRF